MDTPDEASMCAPLIAVGPQQKLTGFGHGVAVSERHRLLVASTFGAANSRCTLDVYALSPEPLCDPVPFKLLRVIHFAGTGSMDEPLSFEDDTTSFGGHLAFVPGPVAQVVVTEPGNACVGVVDVEAAARLPYVAPPGTLAHARHVAVNNTGSCVAVTQRQYYSDRVSPDAIVVYARQGDDVGPGWTRLLIWEDTCLSRYLSGIRWLPGAEDVLASVVTSISNQKYFLRQEWLEWFVRSMRLSGTTVEAEGFRPGAWNADVRDVEVVGDTLVLMSSREALRLPRLGHDAAAAAVPVFGARSHSDSGVLSLAYLRGVGALVVRSGYHVEMLATRDTISMASMSGMRVAWIGAVVLGGNRA